MIRSRKTKPEGTQHPQIQTTEAVTTGGAAARQTWRNIRLIIGREYTARVRGRGYRITTIILILAVVIGAFIPTILQYFSSRPAAQTSVVIVNNAGMAGAGLLTMANTTLNGTTG
ncbi:MAG TPA: hypothetical protein VN648_17320, partial [Candidatus Methylomirabilis sp.]|nr:hypothetical protein [Candidatus Methylomirabilis sp.]